MAKRAIFEGLVVDEHEQLVEIAYVGDDACYVVNDEGFRRHILSETVDRQVLEEFQKMIAGHEDMLSEQTAKMLGQDDIFSRAAIERQLKNIDQHFETLLEAGIPEESRAYMGMMGLRIVINVHGDVVDIHQPGVPGPEQGE